MGNPFKALGRFFKKVPHAVDVITEDAAVKEIFPIVGRIDAAKDLLKGVFTADLAAELRAWPEDRLCAWFVRLGHAFGPPHLTHFSELSPAAQKEILERLPILRRNHDDWAEPFQWMPRRFTAWFGPRPLLPDVIEGHVTALKPIPKNGEWYVLPGYMAATTDDGVHNRLGWRYDDVDDYFDLSIALKRVG